MCQQDQFLLTAMREKSGHASLLASGEFLKMFGIRWLIEASPLSLPSSSHGFILPVCGLCPNFPHL